MSKKNAKISDFSAKQVEEACRALAFAVACFPIQGHDQYLAAGDIFEQVKQYIDKKNVNLYITLDHLKRGISLMKEATRKLEELQLLMLETSNVPERRRQMPKCTWASK